MNTTEKNAPKVAYVTISDDHAEQRLDNFLLSKLKGVPKSHIYRIVRKGEVRVNKGRIDVSYRLKLGDVVRIPPIRVAESIPANFIPNNLREALEKGILFEDDGFLVLNKPAGFAVHGGTGIDSGIIEGLRVLRPQTKFLELVHRLDRDTSGCLIIAKKRSILNLLHDMFRGDSIIQKTYIALLTGQWLKKSLVVNAPLLKKSGKNGERMVSVHPSGKEAETVFTRLQLYKEATLVEALLKTGRTHQIRVHAAHIGHPIVADERYGQDEVNKVFQRKGYKRQFLHAAQLNFVHPVTGEPLSINAPLPKALATLLTHEHEIRG
ncbi:MAG: 23S rRNA pseudouridine(955/2504/2580) synthase RluC [Methylococcaceae bacterium]